MPRLYVDRIQFKHNEDGTADQKLNNYLALPQQYDVTAVQHLGSLYNSAEDVILCRPSYETYLLTRTSA